MGETAGDLLETFGTWAEPIGAPDGVEVAIGIAAGTAAVWLVVRAWRRPPARPVCLFVALFPLALLVASSTSGIDPIGDRLLSPLWPPLLVLGAVELTTTRRRLLRIAVGIWVTLVLAATGNDLVDLARHGSGLTRTNG